MTAKDFSTIKKTLRIIQKVQATTKVHALWISYYNYENVKSINVTIFREEGDTSVDFCFYTFYSPKRRLEEYQKMMDFIENGDSQS